MMGFAFPYSNILVAVTFARLAFFLTVVSFPQVGRIVKSILKLFVEAVQNRETGARLHL
jgi:hypothetical protein